MAAVTDTATAEASEPPTAAPAVRAATFAHFGDDDLSTRSGGAAAFGAPLREVTDCALRDTSTTTAGSVASSRSDASDSASDSADDDADNDAFASAEDGGGGSTRSRTKCSDWTRSGPDQAITLAFARVSWSGWKPWTGSPKVTESRTVSRSVR
eukprot:777004-Prorocentrum_minimum.AAC.2